MASSLSMMQAPPVAPVAPKSGSIWDKISSWGDRANVFLYGGKKPEAPSTPTAMEAQPAPAQKLEEKKPFTDRFNIGLKRMQASAQPTGKSPALHPDMMRMMSNTWSKMA